MGVLAIRRELERRYGSDSAALDALDRVAWLPEDRGGPDDWEHRRRALVEQIPMVSLESLTSPDESADNWFDQISRPAMVRLGIDQPEHTEVFTSRLLTELIGRPAAAHCHVDAYRAAWGWPLRIGIADPELLDQVERLGRHSQLYDVVLIEPGVEATCDLAIVDRSLTRRGRLDLRVGALVVTGDSTYLQRGVVESRLTHVAFARLGAAAVICTANADADWLSRVVEFLSHDNPLDVALAMADPTAALVADRYFLHLTSLRILVHQWDWRVRIQPSATVTVPATGSGAGFRFAEGSVVPAREFADELLRLVGEAPFEAESGTASAAGNGSRALAEAGVGRVEVELKFASPSMTDASPAPPEPEMPVEMPVWPPSDDASDIDVDPGWPFPAQPSAEPDDPPWSIDWPPVASDDPESAEPPETAGDEPPESAGDDAPAELPPSPSPPSPSPPPPPPSPSPPPPSPSQPPVPAPAPAPAPVPPIAVPSIRPLAPPDPHPAAPPRFLNVRPRALDAGGAPTEDEVTGFVASRTYRFDVAVRQRRAAGAQALMAALPEPTPGRDTQVTITVFLRGRIDTAQSKPLALPASGDTTWVSFDVVTPTARDHLELVVVVYHDDALQVAVIDGPVVDGEADLPAEVAWTLRLGSTGDFGTGSVPGLVVDDAGIARLDLAVGVAASTPVSAGKAAMRRRILDALQAESDRPKLKHLAPVLADLAIDGRLLRDQLLGAGPSPLDDAPRIRVASVEAGDPLPLEVLYDHAAPRDNSVPLCPPAAKGAERCDGTCAHRDDPGVVCPFGFWGVSTSIERVRPAHPGSPPPPGNQSVAISSGALVGISDRASGRTASSGRRILRAFRALTGRSRTSAAWSWEEWDDAVAAGPPLLALVTHSDSTGGRPALEIGAGHLRPVQQFTVNTINPGGLTPGPVVLLLGCETAHLETSYTDLVDRMHAVGGAIVIAVQTPVRGAQVAHLVAVLVDALKDQIDGHGSHPVGEVLRATRSELLRSGRIVGLALVSTGDGGIDLA